MSIGLPRITRSEIAEYQPSPDWFVRSADGIHGLAHETRVLIWGQVLAAMAVEDGMSINPEVIGWAAAIHDTQRWDDSVDPQHGDRAAHWLCENPEILPEPVALDRVAYLFEWHVPADHYAPQMTDELVVFKDADALDRWRIGDLDPAFLRTRSARQLLDASHALWAATRSLHRDDGASDKILTAAVELGILVDF